jgi:hypothetical protein
MGTVESLMSSGNTDLAKTYENIITAAVKEHEIPNTNLWIRGFGRDVNGNPLVYVSILDGRKSGIQLNPENLLTVNRNRDMSIFDSDDKKTIKQIEKEILEYVKKYGDPSIKSRLKIYKPESKTKTVSTYKNPVLSADDKKEQFKIILDYMIWENAEDSYEEGEFTKRHVVFEKKNVGSYNNVDEMIKDLSKYGITDNKENYQIFTEDNGRLEVDFQVNDENIEPTKKEIEKWKKGEASLYNAHVSLYVSFAKVYIPKAEEMKNTLNLETI